MADCNNCSSYLSSEDIIRRSVKCSGGSVAFIGSNVNQNLSDLEDKMDLWSSGLSGLTLAGAVGGGQPVLKDFSVLKLTGNAGATTSSLLQAANSFNMLDNTATYEYYLECVIPTIDQGTKSIMYSQAHGLGMDIRGGADAGGWYIYIRDYLGASYGIDGRTAGRKALVAGKNTIKVTINCATKAVTVAINAYSETFIHNINNLLGVAGEYFRIGQTTIELLPVYFKFSVNGVAASEFIFSQQTFQVGKISATTGDFYDMVGSSIFQVLGTTSGKLYQKYWSTQSVINPYKNGYDLYWGQGTIDGVKVNPINALGASKNVENYAHFYTVLPTKIGYHICEYLQMPDLPIFDTTNRTYWKAAITSDPYYVGAIAGKERYFHKSWLDFAWITSHIEDAYLGLFYVKIKTHNATGQKKVNVELSDIVLFNEVVSYSNTRKDIATYQNLGDFYLSRVPEFKRKDDSQEFITFL